MKMLGEIGTYSFADFVAIDQIIRAGLQRIDCACVELGRDAPSGLIRQLFGGDENTLRLFLAALSVPELRRLLAIAERNGKRPELRNSPNEEANTLEHLKQVVRTQR